MSDHDHDRGAYTPPTDEPLSFDARRPKGRRPLPMTLVASVIVLAVLSVAVVLFYRSGVRGANETPRVVGTPLQAAKEAPPADAQPVDEAAELQVYADGAPAAGGAPIFAPPPEQPRARPTAPSAEALVRNAEVALPPAPTAAPPAPATKTVATAQPTLRPAQTVSEPSPPVVSRPIQTAQAELPPAKAAAAARTSPAKAPPAKVAAAPAPAPAAAPTPAASGSAAVQIGAYSSTAIADSEFKKVAAAFSSYAAGKAKRVEPVERNGATLYRTAFTGFSKSEAQAFCQALKASGRDCLVK